MDEVVHLVTNRLIKLAQPSIPIDKNKVVGGLLGALTGALIYHWFLKPAESTVAEDLAAILGLGALFGHLGAGLGKYLLWYD